MLAKLTKVTIQTYIGGHSLAGMGKPFNIKHQTIYINPAFVHDIEQVEGVMKSKNEPYELPVTKITRAGAMVTSDEVIGTVEEIAEILNQAALNKSNKSVAKAK